MRLREGAVGEPDNAGTEKSPVNGHNQLLEDEEDGPGGIVLRREAHGVRQVPLHVELELHM